MQTDAGPGSPGATCPTCGEADALQGRPTDDGIEITCGRCGGTWARGSARCKGCGGEEGVAQRQVMTRTPRGNQRAVVGHREVTLCPVCDALALDESRSAPLPESYVSVFLFGRDTPASRTPPAPRPSPSEVHRTRPDEDVGGAAAGAGTDTPRPPDDPPRPPAEPSRPSAEPSRPSAVPPIAPTPAVSQPTARRAIESYLTAVPDGDSLTMLLLGRHLGASRRIRDLDDPGEGQRLRTWFDETWAPGDDARREAARAGLLSALRHWAGEGWVSRDVVSWLE